METTSLKLYSLDYGQIKTYQVAGLFLAGNIVLPQLAHLLPQGGITWLPIYFFTLVGMPAAAALPVILVKSVLLALAAGYAAARFRKASLWMLAAVVLGYQLAGSLFEWGYTGSLAAAVQDLSIGLPGMLLQLFGGWFVINRLIRK